MASLLPLRPMRLFLARRPAVTGLFRPLPPRHIPLHPRLFSTTFLLRRPNDPPSASPDGLRNNRDLHPAKPSPASPAQPAGVSRADAELLGKLGEGDARPAADVPSYAMVFTCKKCENRSAHRISKQGYHHGTVIVTCPGCKNKHLMSDHLKIFSDDNITLEDILAKKGERLKKQRVTVTGGGDGLEFWDEDDELLKQLADRTVDQPSGERDSLPQQSTSPLPESQDPLTTRRSIEGGRSNTSQSDLTQHPAI